MCCELGNQDTRYPLVTHDPRLKVRDEMFAPFDRATIPYNVRVRRKDRSRTTSDHRVGVIRAVRHCGTAQRDKHVNVTLGAEGAELPRMTPQSFGDYLRSEISKYADLSRRLKLRLE
jgi:hypothetical protein